MTIAGSDITFDFSETDDQAAGFTNMPAASAMGAVSIAFLMLLSASGLSIPTNAGLFASVHTVFREGSLIHPRFPAATVFGNQMCDEVLESIMMALAEPLSDRVCAGWNQFLPAAVSGVDARSGAIFDSTPAVLARRHRRDAGAPTATTRWASPARPGP